MSRVFLAIIALGIAGGCSTPKPSTTLPASTAPIAAAPLESDALAKFRTLRRGMSIEQGRAIVGLPTRETGSGISIDVYQLEDGSEVWLGYAGSGGLIYVNHGENQLLSTGG
jgi:hypothetical protein